jgi:hypothetical protein
VNELEKEDYLTGTQAPATKIEKKCNSQQDIEHSYLTQRRKEKQ